MLVFQQVQVRSTWQHYMYVSMKVPQLLIGQGLMCMHAMFAL